MQSALEELDLPLPGKRRVGGSRKGKQNLTTREMRARMFRSLDRLDEIVGGDGYLVWLGQEHPPVFGALLGKLLPPPKPEEAQQRGLVVQVVSYEGMAGTPTRGVLKSPVPGDVWVEPVTVPKLTQ